MQQGNKDLIGQVLADTYRVERLIGAGGMGAVYTAVHQRLPTRFAIKLLHAEAAANPEIFARFRREAEITSALRHPNIVQVLDFNHLPDGTPYLVMEYLEGEDLGQRLKRVGRMSYPETVALARAIGGGLMAAHKREVVHRDLKPANIFLCLHEQGDEVLEIPKIVDFGISKIRHAKTDTQQTRDQQLLGTPNYMSPEQARGDNSQVDHRTDQWALAAILYQCLTGRLAFAGDTLATVIYNVVMAQPPDVDTLAPDVPQHAVGALRRALCKTRDERYPSVMEFIRAFAGQQPAAQAQGSYEGLAAVGGDQRTPSHASTLEQQGGTPAPAGTPMPGGTPAPQSGVGQRLTSMGPGRQTVVPVLAGVSLLAILAGAGGLVMHQMGGQGAKQQGQQRTQVVREREVKVPPPTPPPTEQVAAEQVRPDADAKQAVSQVPAQQVPPQRVPEAPQQVPEAPPTSHSHRDRTHAPRRSASDKPYDETQDIDLSGIK